MSNAPAKAFIAANKKINGTGKKERPRFIRKHKPMWDVLSRIKLWPSRSGVLHGIKTMEQDGNYMIIETHCNMQMRIRESKNSRAARWLRNKWVEKACPACKIPDWKLSKYGNTFFE